MVMNRKPEDQLHHIAIVLRLRKELVQISQDKVVHIQDSRYSADARQHYPLPSKIIMSSFLQKEHFTSHY